MDQEERLWRVRGGDPEDAVKPGPIRTVKCRYVKPRKGGTARVHSYRNLPICHGAAVLIDGRPVGEAGGVGEAIGFVARRARQWKPGWWSVSFATLDGEWVTLARHSGRTEGWKVLVGGVEV